MMTLFLYVVAASHDPDNVQCVVPYRVNDDVIFFGPCKKPLRKWLRDRYLKTSNDSYPDADIFVVGVNGSNRKRIRKIVWAGSVTRVMTFEVAYNALKGPEFQEMRSHDCSPLHVKPLYDNAGKFLGYEHISHEHERDDRWVLDLTNRRNNPHVRDQGKQLLLKPEADRYQAFPHDCCFLCDNIFFAQGAGIPITDEILKVLKSIQPDKTPAPDRYAIFGYRVDESAEGLTGRYLTTSGKLAEGLITLIRGSSTVLQGTTKRQLRPCKCR